MYFIHKRHRFEWQDFKALNDSNYCAVCRLVQKLAMFSALHSSGEDTGPLSGMVFIDGWFHKTAQRFSQGAAIRSRLAK